MHFELLSTPEDVTDAAHHAAAASLNQSVVDDATGVLLEALVESGPTSGSSGPGVTTVLLKAAAGAGKSFALRGMVRDVLDRLPVREGGRVGAIAFTNKQVESLARSLTSELGKEQVAWLMGQDRLKKLQDDGDPLLDEVTVVQSSGDLTKEHRVVLSTAHRLGAPSELSRLQKAFESGDESPFRVLFVDEAWQLPHYLFSPVEKAAPVVVGVGDVGQLPPLEVGDNPWRGDSRYNPMRAWPHAFEGREGTWSAELPTVWRPHGNQLRLWRAFYPEWSAGLSSVAAPEDRTILADGLTGAVADLFEVLASGRPVALEVDGLPDADAPDVDVPLTDFVGHLVGNLLEADVRLVSTRYGNPPGSPTGESTVVTKADEGEDPLFALLATRNQAVDDAAEAADRLTEEFGLPEGRVVASTVDSWQGQTNGITVATHPLSGAEELDDFNSAFGRLAVTCTRATHGMLLVARPGLDDLLDSAAARAGTPFGEPGRRQLPRQTHQRILESFVRVRISLTADD